MPIEAIILDSYPIPHGRCPRASCDQPFYPFMRGQVQRSKRAWWWPFRTRPYCALICRACKKVVGWEKPSDTVEFGFK